MIAGALRRRRGPLVRYWSADWQLVHTEPVRVETWPQWAGRQWRRLTGRPAASRSPFGKSDPRQALRAVVVTADV